MSKSDFQCFCVVYAKIQPNLFDSFSNQKETIVKGNISWKVQFFKIFYMGVNGAIFQKATQKFDKFLS